MRAVRCLCDLGKAAEPGDTAVVKRAALALALSVAGVAGPLRGERRVLEISRDGRSPD
jgi:hypothetical protein